MKDHIEDLSHGDITAHVNHSLVGRVVTAKRLQGKLVHTWTAWTPIEAKLNEDYQRSRVSGGPRVIDA